ncbi:hypothetical protein PHYBOEH_002728 [Phytophthora boehmeriae]|uniref:Uncharacterized protein n=1 Tax=Phytophthora boehmeriae TaxID=109152 RepID=A0A8T1XCQ6_9STRA|nr:hypothetical protein PHYBOEH_002728 [Phytophthora boehmeriae]
MPLFSEAELLDVLTGIDAGLDKGPEDNNAPGPSVNIVLDGGVFSSEKAFAEFMESLASDEDVNTTTASDDSTSEPSMTEKKRCLEPSAEKTLVENAKPKRKRRKHELDRLRAVAMELEKKLKVLNHSAGRDKPGAGQFWKHISDQMLSERQKAVGENARLRQMVKEQVKSVKSLQRTLAKTPDLSKMEISPVCSDVELSTRCQTSPKDLYQDLFKNISSAYSDGGGKLLQTNAIPPPSTVCNRKMNMEMDMVSESGPQMSLQFVESRSIPFGFVRIGDHAWNFLSGSNGHEDFQMIVRAEMCRCVFEPSEEDPENATIFRACARMSPTLPDDAFMTASVGNVTDIIIQNYEKSVVYIFDAVLESLGK